MARSNSIVVAMLVLSLAACGGSTKSKSTGSGGNAANTSTDGTGGTGTDTGAGTGTGTGSGTDGGTGGTDGGTTDGGTTTPTLISVTLTPATASVAKGTTLQYTAKAAYSDATEQDVTATATWSVAPADIGTIDAAGNFAGVATGTGTITATLGSVPGTATVVVMPATLQSLVVTSSAGSGPPGVDVSFTATGLYSDSTQQDLTAGVSWTSSDATVATISAAGVLSPIAPGSVTVTASSGSISAAITFTVTSGGSDGGGGTTTPYVISVTLTPASASVAKGTTQQYAAMAVYSDATKQDVTAAATWSVAPAELGTIDATGNFAGLVAGAGTITAAFGGVTGTAPVVVTAATLQSLSLSPSAESGPLGIDIPFTAIGIFSDSTQQDLTAAVTWTSSDSAVATISTSGVLSPVAPGTVTVTASSGAITASTTYTVTSAKLSFIAVVPGSVLIAQGTTATLQATGYYNDNTSFDLTGYATWSSSSAAVTVANGVATGVSVGTATVTATFGGFSDTTTITVTAFALQSITLTPAAAALPVGLTQQLAVNGTFADGSTQDLTSLAAFVSSDAAVASVSNASGSIGLVSAIAPGSATITAMIGAFNATASVDVTSAVLQTITVNGPPVLPKNYRAQFLATATYSDGTAVDVTSEATWMSSNTAVATVSTAPGTKGLATGIAVGTATLSATLSGIPGTFTLTVSSAKLTSLAVSPKAFPLAVGGTQQLTAMGTFSDGVNPDITLDITRQCTWRSFSKSIAWVSRTGVVTGASPGSTTILVRKGSVKDSAAATVQ